MNEPLKFSVVKRDVPPPPGVQSTWPGDILMLESEDGLSLVWWGEASLYETDDHPDARERVEESARHAFKELREKREQGPTE